MAKLPPALQTVIRSALRRGIGSKPSGADEDDPKHCNAPVSSYPISPDGDIITGCGAALWVDGRGAPIGYREGSHVERLRDRAIALATNPEQLLTRTLSPAPDKPGVTFQMRGEHSIAWSVVRGTSFLIAFSTDMGSHAPRWIVGTMPARAGEAQGPFTQVDDWEDALIMYGNTNNSEDRLVYNAPLALSSDGEWLLDLRARQRTIRGMRTTKHIVVPAACAGWLRFFDFAPGTGRFHLAVSNDIHPVMGVVRHCQIDRAGRLISMRPLRPLPDSGCINHRHHQCSVALDQVWLGGLVLSTHEDTGMGPFPSELFDARTGRHIPLGFVKARSDRIEGIAPLAKLFVTLRNVDGRLARTETPIDDAFFKRWTTALDTPPFTERSYCIISGIPIPAALCPKDDAFAR